MDEEYEYAVEFTTTVKVKAPDAIEAGVRFDRTS